MCISLRSHVQSLKELYNSNKRWCEHYSSLSVVTPMGETGRYGRGLFRLVDSCGILLKIFRRLFRRGILEDLVVFLWVPFPPFPPLFSKVTLRLSLPREDLQSCFFTLTACCWCSHRGYPVKTINAKVADVVLFELPCKIFTPEYVL